MVFNYLLLTTHTQLTPLQLHFNEMFNFSCQLAIKNAKNSSPHQTVCLACFCFNELFAQGAGFEHLFSNKIWIRPAIELYIHPGRLVSPKICGAPTETYKDLKKFIDGCYCYSGDNHRAGRLNTKHRPGSPSQSFSQFIPCWNHVIKHCWHWNAWVASSCHCSFPSTILHG